MVTAAAAGVGEHGQEIRVALAAGQELAVEVDAEVEIPQGERAAARRAAAIIHTVEVLPSVPVTPTRQHCSAHAAAAATGRGFGGVTARDVNRSRPL